MNSYCDIRIKTTWRCHVDAYFLKIYISDFCRLVWTLGGLAHLERIFISRVGGQVSHPDAVVAVVAGGGRRARGGCRRRRQSLNRITGRQSAAVAHTVHRIDTRVVLPPI